MPKPLSDDLRWRVVWLRLLRGKTIGEIAESLFISSKSVQRYLRRYQVSSDVRPWLQRHGPERQLCQFEDLVLLEGVLRRPSVFLKELRRDVYCKTGRDVSCSTICRALARFGFTRKKIHRLHSRQSSEERFHFKSMIMQAPIYNRAMFIFIDETGFDIRKERRRYGYSPSGMPALERTELFRGSRINAIAAMSSLGILDVSLYEHNVNGGTFLEYLRKYLLPHVRPFNGVNPHSIVVMDNASIHHIQEVAELLHGVGVLLKFLPPYSPDYNPIEEVFSKVKYYFRANHESDSGTSPRELVLSSFMTVTAEDCNSYIDHSGYIG